jgi:hypothetical protein
MPLQTWQNALDKRFHRSKRNRLLKVSNCIGGPSVTKQSLTPGPTFVIKTSDRRWRAAGNLQTVRTERCPSPTRTGKKEMKRFLDPTAGRWIRPSEREKRDLTFTPSVLLSLIAAIASRVFGGLAEVGAS